MKFLKKLVRRWKHNDYSQTQLQPYLKAKMKMISTILKIKLKKMKNFRHSSPKWPNEKSKLLILGIYLYVYELIFIYFSEQISLNEELVVQLEMTMANMESEMEHQRRMYESKLKLLEEKIKQAENDRDLAIKQSQNKDDTSNPKVFIIVAPF